MGNARLLWVMITKETRTTFRERAQMRGLIVSVIAMVLAVGGGAYQVVHGERAVHRRAVTEPATVAVGQENPAPPTVRWMATAVPAFAGFFFSLGYLLSAVLASFVGEKEARTLEVLLAAPMSDGKLYLVKCISVLLPSAVLGCLFAEGTAVLAWGLLPRDMVNLPAGVMGYAMVASLPLVLLPQICLLGLGAAVSIRAETMKGAGQIMGALVILPMFGIIYGLPMVMGFSPGLREAVMRVEANWMELPFALQYLEVLVGLGVPAVGLIMLGRAMFRRDRMLN